LNTEVEQYIEPEDETELEDDILVAYDYYYNNYLPSVSTPEKELAKSILIFAIIDYLSDNKDRESYTSARKWLFHKEDVDYIFNFSSVCYLMEIDVDRFRQRIRKRKKSKVKFIIDGKRIN
jgi:hypothetical protein